MANNFTLKTAKKYQSINLGFIRAGTTVTESYDVVVDNDTLDGSVLTVNSFAQPAWGTITVTYKAIEMEIGPTTVTDGAGPLAAGTVSLPLAGSALVAGAYGQSFALLTGTGVPWPATTIYATNPAQPPVPPFLPGDGTAGVGVPTPGHRGVSMAVPDTAISRNVSTLPYPRTGVKTGGANLLDLDTVTGRKYTLTVKVDVNSGTYDRANPANNTKKFRLNLSDGSKFDFAFCLIEADAKQVGPASSDFVMSRIPTT